MVEFEKDTQSVRHARHFRPDPRNLRKHTPRNVGMIADSIQKQGFGRSILAARDGTILAGNATFEAATQVGLEDVLVVRTDGTKIVVVQRDDLDPASEEALRLSLADNRATDLSGWDKPLIAQLAMDMPDVSIDFFTQVELDELLGVRHAAAVLPDPLKDGLIAEEDVTLVNEPRSAPGVVWRLGRHRLACGKAEDPQTYLSLFGGEAPSVDLLIADPPYNADIHVGVQDVRDPKHKKGHRATNVLPNDRLTEDQYREFLQSCFLLAGDRLHPGACWYIYGPSCGEPLRAFLMALWTHFGTNRQTIVWNKQHFVFGTADFHWQHEMIYFGWRAIERGHPHFRSDDRTQTTVWEVERPTQTEDMAHPSRKPVELAARMIASSCPAGGVILDPFVGGGSVIVAAEHLGRTVYGIELEPRFCDLAIKAWEAVSGEQAVMEDPRG